MSFDQARPQRDGSASRRAHAADYAPMSRAIEESITERGQERQGERPTVSTGQGERRPARNKRAIGAG